MVILWWAKQLFDNEKGPKMKVFFLPWLSPPQVRSFLSKGFDVTRSPPHRLTKCLQIVIVSTPSTLLKICARTRLYPVTMPFNPAMSPSFAAISKYP